MHGLIEDIGLAIIAAAVVSVLAHRFRQPIILAYLAAGVIIGPLIGPQIVHDPEHIDIISEIGLVFLLFIIGLEMNPQHLLAGGRAIFVSGLAQFPLTVALGLLVFLLAGLAGNWLDAFYLAVACSLSSTAIVVKALFDKIEINSVPGRLTVGILIFQDIWAILVIALQPTITNPGILPAAVAVAKAGGLLLAGFLISKYVLRVVFAWLEQAPELVVSVSLGWCALYAGLASKAGLSFEMGALIAGVSLTIFPYSEHITEKILPLRDFFLTFFFISIGMKIPFPEGTVFAKIPLVIGFIIFSRFLIIYPTARAGGAGKRTSFIASLNLAQMSEFSLVVAVAGLAGGHISQGTMSLILYGLAGASIVSSYLLKYNQQIYAAVSTRIAFLSETVADEESHSEKPLIVILGVHRTARAMLARIQTARPDLLPRTLAADFSVEALTDAKSRFGVRTVFGDVKARDTLVRAGVPSAHWILCTIPDTLL
ncbi:MAG: cation:proton antiporter, partial [Spirochaetia bacterium]|nr:cation:proton antiporter [Spirochaetia bacterium]